jgi:DNA-binding transcriptional LysR family regulator
MLQTVLAVAKHGSYRAAGDELGITSSTVTRHIDTISEEIGEPIFVPGERGWEPTEVGKEILQIADETKSKLGFMMKGLENKDGFYGSLQISTLSFVSSEFLAPALHLWKRENPTANLIIDATDETTAVERGEADVALRLTRPDTAGIARFKLANCHVGVFSPKGANADEWIGFAGHLDELAEMKLARGFFDRPPSVRLDSFHAIAEGAISTGQSCILPTCTARNFPDLALQSNDDGPLIATRELWFLFYEKRKNDLSINAARDWLKAVFPSPNRCLCGKCARPKLNEQAT